MLIKKSNRFEISPEYSFLNKVCPQRKIFLQRLTNLGFQNLIIWNTQPLLSNSLSWEKGNTSQVSFCCPDSPKGEGQETERHFQGGPSPVAQAHPKPKTNHRTSVSTAPHHHIIKDLITTDNFTQYIISCFQQKVLRHSKRKNTI